MTKNKFILYDEHNNFIEEFDSIIKLMKKYNITSNVGIYKSIKEGTTFIFNKNSKDKKYRVERIDTIEKKTTSDNLPEDDNKKIIYEVDSRACKITRTTRKEMAEKYNYTANYIAEIVRHCKQVAPGIYLIQHWYDTWEYL